MIQEVNEIRSKRLALKRLVKIADSVGVVLNAAQKDTINCSLRNQEMDRLRTWVMSEATFDGIVRQAQYIKRVASDS